MCGKAIMNPVVCKHIAVQNTSLKNPRTEPQYLDFIEEPLMTLFSGQTYGGKKSEKALEDKEVNVFNRKELHTQKECS